MDQKNTKMIFMKPRILVGGIVLFIGAVVFMLNSPAKKWEVVLPDLPAKISTVDASLNGVHYILKQTHEPLFRIENGTDFSSRILSRWSRNLDYTSFLFCPNTDYSFASGERFSLEYFNNYISSVTASYSKAAKVIPDGGCTKIEFSKPNRSYLEYLTQYSQAPTVAVSSAVESGLGKYYVKEVSDSRIVLQRKSHQRRGYDEVVFHQYHGAGSPEFLDRNVSDFNKISSVEIPQWVKSEYVFFEDVVVNTVVLVINHPDKKIRDATYNCMDVRELRKAFLPERKTFLDISNVIPIGINGAKPGLPQQNCSANNKQHGEMVFVDLRTGNEKTLLEYFRKFSSKTGLRVKLVNMPVAKFWDMLKTRPTDYNLVMISKDSMDLDVSVFLKYSHYLSYRQPSIENLYKELMHTDDPDRKQLLAEKIAGDILEERSVLPVYQNLRGYYYPRGIKNIDVGHGFFEFPEVADLRW